jgi:hypothetical protein
MVFFLLLLNKIKINKYFYNVAAYLVLAQPYYCSYKFFIMCIFYVFLSCFNILILFFE